MKTILTILLLATSLAANGAENALSFGVVPQQSASKLAKLWIPILTAVGERAGVEIRFKTAPDIPTFEQRLARGEYDLAYMNPYHFTMFNQKPGYRALARARDKRIKGILVVRQDDGSWSNPAFITLTGGSFGFQAGVQRTDVVLVFKTRRGVDNIANGKLTLGADASVAAGPVGRSVEGATDIRFQAEIVSYSRARGIFAGVSFAGSGVTMDRKANAAFYSSPSMTPEMIFASSPNIAPDVANRFVQVLTAQTTRLAQAPGMATSRSTPAPAAEQESSVQTCGIPGPGESDENLDSDESYFDPNY